MEPASEKGESGHEGKRSCPRGKMFAYQCRRYILVVLMKQVLLSRGESTERWALCARRRIRILRG